jgi:hypothetical protein
MMNCGRLKSARGTVSTIVRMLRARPTPPERVLIRVKELLASLPQNERAVMDSVRERLVRWAIEEYYRAD